MTPETSTLIHPISSFTHQRRPFTEHNICFVSATQGQSPGARSPLWTWQPDDSHTWGWQNKQSKPRCYCMSNLIGHCEGGSAWRVEFRDGLSLLEREKSGYDFLSTKNRKARRLGLKYVCSGLLFKNLYHQLICGFFSCCLPTVPCEACYHSRKQMQRGCY